MRAVISREPSHKTVMFSCPYEYCQLSIFVTRDGFPELAREPSIFWNTSPNALHIFFVERSPWETTFAVILQNCKIANCTNSIPSFSTEKHQLCFEARNFVENPKKSCSNQIEKKNIMNGKLLFAFFVFP